MKLLLALELFSIRLIKNCKMGPLFRELGSDSSSNNLVEFRAGKMHLRGTTVTADKRKGLVYVHQSDDSLMHFCWKDRTSGVVEDDLIIFPDDIEYKNVAQCTTGRVFVLKFKLSNRKFFFWMQEPKDEKDEDHCKKVNEYLNNPPAPGSAGGGSSLSGLSHGLSSLGDQLGDSGLQSLLSGMDQNQIMQLLSSSGLAGSVNDDLRSTSRPSTGRSTAASTAQTPRPNTQVSESTQQTTAKDTAATVTTTTTTAALSNTNTATTGSNAPVQLSDLQSILADMNSPQQVQQEAVDLSTSFNTEALAPLFADAEVRRQLCQFLPEVNDLSNSEQEIRETIQSPQFKQALSTFSHALQSGQLGPLIQQFGLGSAATNAAAKGDIFAFVQALQDSEKSKSSNQATDDDMGLD